MTQRRVKVDHPLWEKLRRLDRVLARFFPEDILPGFDALGLMLHSRFRNGGYWCTPSNTLAFAGTGGDGTHFSFLVQDGRVTERSPVAMTVLDYSEQPNYMVGESLFDFLCLGYHRGYFAMGTLPSEKGFAAYSSARWRPQEEADYAIGLGINETHRELRDFVIEELQLSPWKQLKRKFQRLQKQYLPLLEMPECGSGRN